MRRTLLATFVFTGAALAAALCPATVRADEWSKTYTVTGRAELRVGTDDGDVTIVSSDQKQIDAHVTTEGYKIGPSDVRIEEHQDGDHVVLNVKLPRINWSWLGGRHHSVHIDVHVPRDLDLDVHTGDGNVSAQSVAGRIRIDTGDGHVNATGLKGEVNMHSGDGHITASGLDGSLMVDTGDGHINVDGRFDALNLRTGDGNIEARVMNGSKVGSSWRLHSGDGRINVSLPSDLNADLEAHTGDGHITLDVPISVSGSLSRSSIHGKLNGGGGTISISSGDGSIHVQKL
jgi:putative adhesin